MDNLDTLSDAALSETFAVEVAGWTRGNQERGDMPWYCGPVTRRGGYMGIPSFATSADAVLPHMAGIQWTARNGHDFCDEMHRVTIHRNGVGHVIAEAFAPTFARAACIALIRAKRAEKGAHA